MWELIVQIHVYWMLAFEYDHHILVSFMSNSMEHYIIQKNHWVHSFRRIAHSASDRWFSDNPYTTASPEHMQCQLTIYIAAHSSITFLNLPTTINRVFFLGYGHNNRDLGTITWLILTTMHVTHQIQLQTTYPWLLCVWFGVNARACAKLCACACNY